MNSPEITKYEHAACATHPKDLFFPHGEGQAAQLLIRQAKTICARCPHQISCRDEGRETGSQGIWGGETERERDNAGYRIRWSANLRRVYDRASA